jgi:hypothetical protein
MKPRSTGWIGELWRGSSAGRDLVITTRLGGRSTHDASMLLKGEGMATSDRMTGTRDE